MFSRKVMWLCVFAMVGFILLTSCYKDTDKDGILDKDDNCVEISNSDQADYDGDGYGDLCDNCPTVTFLRFSDQRDSDEDGIGDVCDNCINAHNPDQTDTDLDGIGDACASEADQHQYELLAKASPDECYYGIGEPNVYDPTGFDSASCASTDGQPKINEGYIWGMTKVGDNIFFGTNANVVCGNPDSAHPYDTSDIWVCERTNENNTNPDVDMDHRPPSIYAYNTATRILNRLSVNEEDVDLLNNTSGLRSAANHNGVVFIAGPGYDIFGKQISVFAFNASNGEPLGAQALPYKNIRHWLIANGELYCGVASKDNGGTVLKWTGSLNDPFQFEVVGRNIGFDVDYLCFHDSRIFVSTWPAINLDLLDLDFIPSSGKEASVWMSPALDDELDESSADSWEKVWSIKDYEPDDTCAMLSAGGPLASYGGWLYWSTMHAKNQAQVYKLLNGLKMIKKSDRDYIEKGAYRAISIFRGQNFHDAATQKIELLYGEENLDTFSIGTGWSSVPNKMDASNRVPKYGHSGFGNLANNYTWTMKVFNGKLYVGTMDELGADLYCFPNSNSEAMPVNIYGLGNVANHGFRTMVADDHYLYIGTANHYSLSTYTADEFISANPAFALFEDTSTFSDLSAVGGWELIRLEVE